MDFAEHTRGLFQMTRPAPRQVHLTIRVWDGDRMGLEEGIRETIHDVPAVCGLLEAQGFRDIRLADSLLDDGGHGTTWFITARKP